MRGEQSDGGNNSFGFADAPKDNVSSGSFSFGKGRGTVTGRFLVSFVVVKRDGLGGVSTPSNGLRSASNSYGLGLMGVWDCAPHFME